MIGDRFLEARLLSPSPPTWSLCYL